MLGKVFLSSWKIRKISVLQICLPGPRGLFCCLLLLFFPSSQGQVGSLLLCLKLWKLVSEVGFVLAQVIVLTPRSILPEVGRGVDPWLVWSVREARGCKPYNGMPGEASDMKLVWSNFDFPDGKEPLFLKRQEAACSRPWEPLLPGAHSSVRFALQFIQILVLLFTLSIPGAPFKAVWSSVSWVVGSKARNCLGFSTNLFLGANSFWWRAGGILVNLDYVLFLAKRTLEMFKKKLWYLYCWMEGGLLLCFPLAIFSMEGGRESYPANF